MAMMKTVFTTAPRKFTNRQAASRQYPLAFMCEWAQAVLDGDTGDLLEYQQLIKKPKYKGVWRKSFAKEIRQLAYTTKTIAFVTKHQIPHGVKKGNNIWTNCMRLPFGKGQSQPNSDHSGR